MLHSIRIELKRMFISRSFFLALLLSSSLSIANFLQNLYYKIIDVNDFSVFNKWLGASDITFGGLVFYWIFPILASLPYAWTLCDEIHSGYAIQILTRSSKKEYFISKLFSSFISGGIVIAVPLILDILLLMMLDVTYYPQPNDLISSIWSGSFCSILFYKKPILFVVIWTFVEFLWGGAVSLLCCAIGLYIKKKILLIPSMLLIFICEAILSGFIQIKRNGYFVETAWLTLIRSNISNVSSGWVIFGSITLILIIGICLSLIKGIKYESV